MADPYPYDLGSYGRSITSASAEAREWARRGLLWCYGFHFEEALTCFARAIAADARCPLAHWGRAWASGPNYNYPWALMDDAGRAAALASAHEATLAALAHRGRANPAERALIDALPARYPAARVLDDPAEMAGWDAAFADAMRAASQAHPDDPDVTTVYADALMNLTPWQMWDLTTGAPAKGARTAEAQTLLERAIAAQDAPHPGLLHLYIHLMEMSPTPEKALRAADALRGLVPDAGHLEHMASHIDVLCGDYAAVIRDNQRAARADEKVYAQDGGMTFYTLYRIHNYHFIIYGALFAGQIAPALAANRALIETTPPALLALDSPPMADFLEPFLAFEPHILIRFGRWAEIFDLPFPDDPTLHCTHVATLHYARGVAHAALGQVAEAEAEQTAFRNAHAAIPESRLLHNNRVTDLMQIADAMLAGEIAYREGAYEAAFTHLRTAVIREDTLPYDEPWGWMQPSRHALGALLFEQGHIAEAEQVYREDLGLSGPLPRAQAHPDNVWSLKGLLDCLEARSATAEADLLRQRLAIVAARADAPVTASCFCAQAAMKPSRTIC